MVPLAIKVMGRNWKVKSYSHKLFDKKHGETTEAICLTEPREIHFRYGVSLSTVIHEITHAYFAGLCIDSAQLEQHQLEDVACDLMAEHGERIILDGRKLWATLD